MHRAIGRRTAFESDADARVFLSLLAREVHAGEIALEAHAVLQTHFHLLVKSLEGRLSDAMRRILGTYAQYFNRTRERDGSLFRIRFLSKRVESRAYRSLLYGYIDDNPVQAGLAERPEDYPHGSARWYARRSGPVWLARDWAEAEVMAMTGAPVYRPEDYSRRFATRITPAIRELVWRRLCRRGEDHSEFDDLLASPSAGVRQWMVERAALADGTRPLLPIAPPATIIDLVRGLEQGGRGWWQGIGRHKVARATELLLPGLLAGECGLTQREIAVRIGMDVHAVRRRLVHHRTALLHDGFYAHQAAQLLRAALATVFPRHPTRGHDPTYPAAPTLSRPW